MSDRWFDILLGVAAAALVMFIGFVMYCESVARTECELAGGVYLARSDICIDRSVTIKPKR